MEPIDRPRGTASPIKPIPLHPAAAENLRAQLAKLSESRTEAAIFSAAAGNVPEFNAKVDAVCSHWNRHIPDGMIQLILSPESVRVIYHALGELISLISATTAGRGHEDTRQDREDAERAQSLRNMLPTPHDA